MLREIGILVFVILALFLGLPPHKVHCDLLATVTKMTCPPHILFIFLSVALFALAVILANWEYLFGIANNLIKVTENFLSK